MTRFDLNVDSKLQSNLKKANAAFSKVHFPSAVAVIDMLVQHRIALLLEETFDGIKSGNKTLRGVFLDPEPAEGDFVVLLTGREIHSVTYRLWDNDDWPGRRARIEEVLCIAKDCLSSLGLLPALESIGVTITSSPGISLEDDVIMFDRI